MVEKLLAKKPPLGPKRPVKAAIRGWAAGYDDYLEKVGVEGIPDPALPRQGLGEADRRDRRLAPRLPALADRQQRQLHRRPGRRRAAGRRAATGRRDGGERLAGGALLAPGDAPRRGRSARTRSGSAPRRPGPATGCCWPTPTSPGSARSASTSSSSPCRARWTCRDRASAACRWSTSASTATSPGPTPSPRPGASPRSSSKLVPGEPTSYVLDGKTRKMTSRTVRVKVKTQGGLETRKHTFWYSRLGPILDLPQALLLLEHRQRLRARRRQRRQPAGRQRLVRHRPGPQRRRPGQGAVPRPGRPLGQHDRRRRSRPGALPGQQRRPPRDQGEDRHLHPGRPAAAGLPGGRPDHPRRLHLELRLGERPRRGAAGDLRGPAPADPAAARLRPELQRLLLVHEPEAPADRVLADHRLRGYPARPPHPLRDPADPAAARGLRRAAGEALHALGAAAALAARRQRGGHPARRPARRPLRCAPDGHPARHHRRRRLGRLPGDCATGTPTRASTARGAWLFAVWWANSGKTLLGPVRPGPPADHSQPARPRADNIRRWGWR